MNWNCNYVDKSPTWVSEDLRDGNQSIIKGYNLKDKIKIWELLIDIGIKQIVLGFPASNKHDYNFIKYLIKNKLIPKNVTISVLTPAKKNLINYTINIIKEIDNSIIHLYNSVSKVQRKIVFKMNKKKNFNFTVENINFIINLINKVNKNIIFQYSPESFSDCELFFSKKICYMFSYLTYINKIKSIINLPTTVENTVLNKYINSIQYIKKKIFKTILSIHTHNDMSGAISTAHCAILAGATRVEGTLFGNGERAGNASLLILASNYYNMGINPKIKINFNKKLFNFLYKKRIPWYSNLNFVAFSGSHQDAICKSFFLKSFFSWKVLYVPINPKIFSNNFKNLIKINSQSGKGGLNFIFKYNFKLNLEKKILNKIYLLIQDLAEILLTEIYKEMIFSIFINFSVNLIKKKYKIVNLYMCFLFKNIVYILLIKYKKKKYIKIINIIYE